MASNGPKESDSSSRIWRYLRNIWSGESSEPTLREQIEEVIDEADEEAEGSLSVARDGDLSQVERDMLRNMLSFGEQTVDDVAVPRGDIIAIDESASFDEAVALFAEADHSRLPVFRGSLDNVIGMLHVKDLFGIMARAQPHPEAIASLMRQPLYVPQSMSAMELLAEMRAKRTHLAIVLDEYGGTDGLLTIEDLMEEIVGEIEDEHDDAPLDLIVPIGEGMWDVDARAELDDLSERLDRRLSHVEGDVDTLGGLAFVLAGHVPQPGEILTHNSGWTIEILAGDERRITSARLCRPTDMSGHAGD